MNLEKINKELKDKSPQEIVAWALNQGEKPVVTTNFRPYEGAIIHLVNTINLDVEIIWCDTGYNTPNTYYHAKEVIEMLELNVHMYVPSQTTAYRDVFLGIPEVNTPAHKIFSDQVKLEPFKRAMAIHKPDVWFTNIRSGQTSFRDSIDIVSMSKDGILKVSPFYYWSDSKLDEYLLENKIPNEFKYFDPTKALNNRECGIHN